MTCAADLSPARRGRGDREPESGPTKLPPVNGAVTVKRHFTVTRVSVKVSLKSYRGQAR